MRGVFKGVLWVAGALSVLAVAAWQGKDHVPSTWTLQAKGLIQGFDIDHDVRIAMPDGTRLAASLYKPRGAKGPLPTIYVRLPYGRLHHGEALAMSAYAKFGYAVLVQDVRGKHDSEGEFKTWAHATGDGAATLDWITQQSWSNGKVGTIGCSALGELQYSLARAHHPAHKAMIASGAGGGIGLAMGGYEAFGWFESGVFQLAAGFGWFQENGTFSPKQNISTHVNHAESLRQLPMKGMVARVQSGPNGFDEFLSIPLHDRRWDAYDFVNDRDQLKTPALVVNTWGDQTLQGSLDLAALNAKSGVPQHVILGPGNHCEHLTLQDTDRFGELEVKNAKAPLVQMFRSWFDYWLKGEGDGLQAQPPYMFYVLGEHRWLAADQWPPKEAQVQRWYLHSQGKANSAKGDGLLTMEQILTLKLNADWVVLSACNTASGEGAGSEAVSGLGRAFFYAGARALLVSNWPVDSEAARLLMTDLFQRQQARAGQHKAVYLREAMLQMVQSTAARDPQGRMKYSYAHPLFWAPFVVVGD